MEDTIYAPSSAIGGAIAVIRVSGPEAGRVSALLSRDPTQQPRKLLHVKLSHNGELIDECMAAYLPAPGTYTGEDMVELNCHGGMQTIQRVLGALGSLGFRPAEAGEFTKRAFLNGKMDLSAAEAVMDVINADAEQSLKAALLQLQGSVRREIESVESLLLDALSGIDAAIDYPDEAEADTLLTLPESLEQAKRRVETLIAESRRGRVLRDGLRVAIVGRPNVGKSSLMNALLGMDRAIVTAEAGTTRDLIDEKTSFQGVPVRLIDTAGIREADSEAERIGVDRAREAIQTADVVCAVLDASAAVTAEDEALLRETAGMTRLVLLNKCDLAPESNLSTRNALRVSAKTGEGLTELERAILTLAAPERGDGAYITNERHIRALERALESLNDALSAFELDCAATDVKNALHYLGSITGTDVDASVIDRIFERFCVGK
ncbi:MAG TPA: tRNA uridine-5-carboxymethylaminomethyl(34) synthesis GTPase MnmE [Feifaniaceae bacterium]|nr:tRNA uridine-5-carboxymethylaminomethyl(34) synthesis GTPase MnmE [Feifaniaceae bacterium]